MGISYQGKARSIAEKEHDSGALLAHCNGISREIIRIAENGGDIFVYSIVPINELGLTVPSVKYVASEESDMPAVLAHKPVEIEYIPPDIEVGTVLSELVVHHQGARIIYPQGLASYDVDGKPKLGTRYFAYFPSREDSQESYILNGSLVRFECVEDPVCGHKYRMKVITAQENVVVICQYSADADIKKTSQNEFVLENARILCPATAERLDVAPIERKFVTERLMTEDAEGIIHFLEDDVVAVLQKTGRKGFYQLLLEGKNLERVTPRESKEFHTNLNITTKNHGVRNITIPTLLPQFNDGLACSDFADAIMTEHETFKKILGAIYETQHVDIASSIES